MKTYVGIWLDRKRAVAVAIKQPLRSFEREGETIKDADKILVMGPGKTKQELKNHIEKRKTMASKISDLQPCDKTTDNQISSRVRTFFKTS